MPDQWMATTLGKVSRGPVPRASTDHVASPAPADRSWRGVCPPRQRPQLTGGVVRRRRPRGPGQMAGRPTRMNSGGGQEPRQRPPGRHDARHDGTAPRRPRTNNAGTMPRGPATPPQPRCAGRRPVADGRHVLLMAVQKLSRYGASADNGTSLRYGYQNGTTLPPTTLSTGRTGPWD